MCLQNLEDRLLLLIVQDASGHIICAFEPKMNEGWQKPSVSTIPQQLIDAARTTSPSQIQQRHRLRLV